MNIKQHIKTKISEIYPEMDLIQLKIETPPDIKMGDIALPCFDFAKILKKSPIEIAKNIAENFANDQAILKTEIQGAYLNFFINPKFIFQATCEQIFKEKTKYGQSKFGDKQKILLEYSSPNTNKPLHLGHARNNVLGMALANILEALDYKVIKANLINDRGIHINKSLLAYQKWGFNKTPETEGKKGDHFVGDFYVLYDQMKKELPEIEEEIKAMLLKWEAGDKQTIALWKKMNKWAISGMMQTYKRMGCKFDVIYYESEVYKQGKELVEQGVKDKIFTKEADKSISIDLTDKGLDKKVLLRSDGTSMYMTQDLATSKRKFEQYSPTKTLWVVGSEQEYHFKVLFEILELMGLAKKDNLVHIAYGMVALTSGKMKSREGNVVDIDNLLDELSALAKKEISTRDEEISETELTTKAEIVAQGALKYYLLKANFKKNITFNPEESIAFDGHTGPYIQYAFARIQSLKNKAPKISKINKINWELLGNIEERKMINLLAEFPETIKESASEYNPAKIANYLYELAQDFNHFYHQHPVLHTENESLVQARIVLVDCVGIVLKNGLGLLGIEVVDKM
jgi:arginyl-tRNA synthetase